MTGLAERFEAKVDRSGEHHLWTGAVLSDGSGQIRVNGKVTTARRVAWEVANGPIPDGARVGGCPDEMACVRVDHLSLLEATRASGKSRRLAPRGSGTRVEIRPGVWKLTVTAGRYPDGRLPRECKTIFADSDSEAAREQAAFAVEVRSAPPVVSQGDRGTTMDDAVERYLVEHLVNEKGRAPETIRTYRNVHSKWFSPEIGRHRVRDVEEADIDRIFGRMRRAGLSTSRLQDARNLYQPFFRWAKRRRLIRRSPMADFELPTSTYEPQELVPPEVPQLCLYLRMAVEVIPDVAPVLTLGATTGMRPGELVTVRRSGLFPEKCKIRIRAPKTRKERELAVDRETMAMLLRHCTMMDELAAAGGVEIDKDAFVFSLQPDCSVPMSTHFVTKRVAELKDHLGIAAKRPETIAREDEALRLFREVQVGRQGTTGAHPKGGISYAEIGRRLNRSERWAFAAVRSAERREAAAHRDPIDIFDGSARALRKFTSSELLDNGFNMSMVARRQGHSPQVLVKHYAKARHSAAPS